MLKALGKAGNIYMSLGLSAAPLIIPLVPGYTNDTLEMCASELSRGYAKELSPQIMAMIDDARTIIHEKTGQRIDSQIFDYGHSKESTFANNFATLFPEKIRCLAVGGDEFFTLPIDEIRLRIVEQIGEMEEFEIRDGVPYRNVTQEQLNKIIEEYVKHKQAHQKEIIQNDDGSYSLPMNYPLGTADIEHYIDISRFSGGKEEYKRVLAQIPRMIFVGENEEEVEGHYAYQSGITQDGIPYDYADELGGLGYDREDKPLHEVERASMHNRVLEYQMAILTLFGRGANERLATFMKLSEQLGLDIQDKIYKGAGHHGILTRDLSEDMKTIYSRAKKSEKIPQLSDQASAKRIRPIYQLIRRAKATADEKEFQRLDKILPKLPEKPQPDANGNRDWEKYDREMEIYRVEIDQLESIIDEYISSKYPITERTNMDKLYDSLSSEELVKVFTKEKSKYQLAERGKYIAGRKIGLFIEDVEENINQRATVSGMNQETQHIKSKTRDRNEPEAVITKDEG